MWKRLDNRVLQLLTYGRGTGRLQGRCNVGLARESLQRHAVASYGRRYVPCDLAGRPGELLGRSRVAYVGKQQVSGDGNDRQAQELIEKSQ
jgi:hypothetical protein